MYAGVVKFVERLQSEKEFMVVEVELFGKLSRKTLSQRSIFWENIHDEIRKIVEPITNFQSSLKVLKEFVFHGVKRSRENITIPVIPDFVNEIGKVNYLLSINYLIFLSSYYTESGKFKLLVENFVKRGTEKRLECKSNGSYNLNPISSQNYEVPMLENSINLDQRDLNFFTNENTYKVIIIISQITNYHLIYYLVFYLTSENRNYLSRVTKSCYIFRT